MAQLIKLRDYISRYEWNAYRYPSQYIRLKQDNWRKLHHLWTTEKPSDENKPEEQQSSGIFKLWELMSRSTKLEETDDSTKLPSTKEELKHYFLDNLYPLQLKWATSTISEVSFMDQQYKSDDTLKYFLQRFPDIYLIMYFPIFNINNSIIDGEIIMISPIGIEVIHLLEKDPSVEIMAVNERTWTIDAGPFQTKELSPMIALKRNEQIISSILNAANIKMPIQKTVLSRTNNIIFSTEPYRTKIIGKHQYKAWFQKKRNLNSPLKSDQLKVIEALLNYCQSSSVRRPEWVEDTNTIIEDYED